MRWSILILFVFFLFIIEGTLFPWIIPYPIERWVSIDANPLLIATLFIGIHMHRYKALGIGFAFGLLKDIVYYGHVIGVYTFSTAIMGYLTGAVFRHFQQSMLLVIAAVAIGDLMWETIVFGLYLLLDVVNISFRWAFFHQILPTALFNTLLALPLYSLFQWLMERYPADDEDEAVKKF
jgi:rod shape-determining protein MreD